MSGGVGDMRAHQRDCRAGEETEENEEGVKIGDIKDRPTGIYCSSCGAEIVERSIFEKNLPKRGLTGSVSRVPPIWKDKGLCCSECGISYAFLPKKKKKRRKK